MFSRGDIGNPSSARRSAGSNSLAQGSLPCCLCASSSSRTAPGVPTERPPTTASMKGIALPSGSRNSFSSAAIGAVSRPSYALTRLPSQCIMKAPPPSPELCGSTSPSTSWIAIAASTALPPDRRISRPASVARGLAEAAM